MHSAVAMRQQWGSKGFDFSPLPFKKWHFRNTPPFLAWPLQLPKLAQERGKLWGIAGVGYWWMLPYHPNHHAMLPLTCMLKFHHHSLRMMPSAAFHASCSFEFPKVGEICNFFLSETSGWILSIFKLKLFRRRD